MTITPSLSNTATAITNALIASTAFGVPVDVRPFEGTPEQFLVQASGRQPALGVVFAGGEFEPAGEEFVLVAEWVVLVLARNYRSEAARRAPPAGEAGGFGLAQAVVTTLSRQDLDLDGLKPLEPQGIELMGAAGASDDRSLCVYQVVFRAEHDVRHAPPQIEVDELQATYETRDTSGWSDVAADAVEVP